MTTWRETASKAVIASEAKQSIHRLRRRGLLRRKASLRKRFVFVAGNDGSGIPI
jgi:hypothetical protein